MRRFKIEPSSNSSGWRRLRSPHLLLVLAAFYLIFISFKLPSFLEMAASLGGDDNSIRSAMTSVDDVDLSKPLLKSAVYEDAFHRKLEDNGLQYSSPAMMSREEQPVEETEENGDDDSKENPMNKDKSSSQQHYGGLLRRRNSTGGGGMLEKMADEAWILGKKAWEDAENFELKDITTVHPDSSAVDEVKTIGSCPSWVSINGEDLSRGDKLMFLPCGLAAGSSITVIGTPHHAHQEYVPQLAKLRNVNPRVMVSQFMVELQGLKAVDGEQPPKILHLNPRLRGDWSHHPVIEHNTCYRMQWGTAQRCDGLESKNEEDLLDILKKVRVGHFQKLVTGQKPNEYIFHVHNLLLGYFNKGKQHYGYGDHSVDGHVRCGKWTRDDIIDAKESKTTVWFKRFIGREQKPDVTWPFPFAEGRLFVLTIHAGVDGYHIIVGGRHISAFPYRTGFTLEDATGLAVMGNVDVHSVYATSLPTSHRSFSPERVLEMSDKWKAQPFPKHPIRLFVGILSATNHFAERMAIRKTWMQSSHIKSSDVVVRFFVALNPRKEVNAMLKKEASYFGDVVILPFMDRYELVVLKTIAICEFGVRNVTAAYVMKCDDDTFVRVDAVLKEIEGIPTNKSLYMGNLNLLHRPLRTGKWAVTYEEWPENIYPPYANGPGYVISNDIAEFVISKHKDGSLKMYKMEDVSMGVWVGKFNSTSVSAATSVQYSHNWKFCQYGCMADYYTAHYQSPRQMLCLWDKLARGQPHCCNFR